MSRMVWNEQNKKRLKRLGKKYDYKQIASIMGLKKSDVLNALSRFKYPYIRLRDKLRPMKRIRSHQKFIKLNNKNIIHQAWV